MSGFNPEIAAKAIMPREIQAKASSLHLGIHLHPEFVQIMVNDPDSHVLLWSDVFNLEDSFQNDFTEAVEFISLRNWGDKVFRKTSITFDSPDFTLIPQGFIIAGKEGEMLKFSTNRDPENTETFQLQELGATLIYDLPHKIKSLSSKFPNARFYNSTSFFIKEAIRNSNSKMKFHVLVQSGFMLLIACNGSDVKLTNHFGVQGQDDVLYHIANAALRLEVDMDAAEIMLYGKSANSSLEELLNAYVGSVNYWDRLPKMQLDNEVHLHERYASLIHMVCA